MHLDSFYNEKLLWKLVPYLYWLGWFFWGDVAISLSRRATTLAISLNSSIYFVDSPLNSIWHFENLVGESLVICTESYCNSTQNMSIFSMDILFRFSDGQIRFYLTKRQIYIIWITSNHGNQSYGAIFFKTAIGLYQYTFIILIVFTKFWSNMIAARIDYKIVSNEANWMILVSF